MPLSPSFQRARPKVVTTCEGQRGVNEKDVVEISKSDTAGYRGSIAALGLGLG